MTIKLAISLFVFWSATFKRWVHMRSYQNTLQILFYTLSQVIPRVYCSIAIILNNTTNRITPLFLHTRSIIIINLSIFYFKRNLFVSIVVIESMNIFFDLKHTSNSRFHARSSFNTFSHLTVVLFYVLCHE